MTETAEPVGCGDDVPLHDDAEIGSTVDCPTCGTEREVVDVDPVAVELAPDRGGSRGE